MFARAGVVCATLVLVGLAGGCRGALVNQLFLLETPRQAYLIDELYDGHRWWSGSADGYDEDHVFYGGYFIAKDHRQLIVTTDTYPGHLELRMKWEIWYSNESPAYDNGDSMDFAVALIDDESGGFEPVGPGVHVKLFSGGQAGDDILAIVAPPGVAEDPVFAFTEASPVSNGTLVVLFDRRASPPMVSALLYGDSEAPRLVASMPAPDGWPQRVRVALSVSGRNDITLEPRAIDSVHLLRPEDQ